MACDTHKKVARQEQMEHGLSGPNSDMVSCSGRSPSRCARTGIEEEQEPQFEAQQERVGQTGKRWSKQSVEEQQGAHMNMVVDHIQGEENPCTKSFVQGDETCETKTISPPEF